jgi:hypothetical protein
MSLLKRNASLKQKHVIGPVRHNPEGAWNVIDEREASGIIDTWTEYLCLRLDLDWPTLAVSFPHPVTESWDFREDFEDAEGLLELPAPLPAPAFADGQLIFGTVGDYLVGEFVLTPDGLVKSLPAKASVAEIESALKELRWETSEELVQAISASLEDSPGDQPTLIPAETIEAYLTTFYLFGESFDKLIRIGTPSRDLQELYSLHGVETATFITAWNPEGSAASRPENDIRQRLLLRDLDAVSINHFDGLGQGEGDWPPEPSQLLLGCTWLQAIHLGQHYSQNAIVWVGKDAVPKLVLLR